MTPVNAFQGQGVGVLTTRIEPRTQRQRLRKHLRPAGLPSLPVAAADRGGRLCSRHLCNQHVAVLALSVLNSPRAQIPLDRSAAPDNIKPYG
jgi:hypothetical protein